MMKWEEFEHIHVVRKIREVVGNWFDVDILFVDDQGRLRNFDKGTKKLWSNTLLAHAMKSDAGHDFLSQTVEKVNNHMAKSDVRYHEYSFVPGVWGTAFPILVDGEYFGTVHALCFRKDTDTKVDPAFVSQVKTFGLSESECEKAFLACKVIQSSEMHYFRELTDLVAQEIVTLKKEITNPRRAHSRTQQRIGWPLPLRFDDRQI